MRSAWVIIGGLILAGCASRQPQPLPQANTGPAITESAGYASAALAFDPPITLSEPTIDLSRSDRGEAAFFGFEDTTTTYYSVETDDRQTTDRSNRFEREAYVAKVGSTRR